MKTDGRRVERICHKKYFRLFFIVFAIRPPLTVFSSSLIRTIHILWSLKTRTQRMIMNAKRITSNFCFGIVNVAAVATIVVCCRCSHACLTIFIEKVWACDDLDGKYETDACAGRCIHNLKIAHTLVLNLSQWNDAHRPSSRQLYTKFGAKEMPEAIWDTLFKSTTKAFRNLHDTSVQFFFSVYISFDWTLMSTATTKKIK